MERVTGIGGVFFRSKDPEATKAWYRDNLGVDLGMGAWMQAAGPTVYTPFDHETDYFGRDNQQWMVNFRVTDLDAMMAQLKAAGIAIETREEWDSEIGRFARIHDPDGTPIELWEPAGPAAAV